MCGRYSIAVEPTEIEERFRAEFSASRASGVPDAAEIMRPRYNAAPSQRLPVILNDDPGRIVLARWGVKPVWMTRVARKDGLINVRMETLRDKRTFQSDLAGRRCLIPADGFYEWKAVTGTRKIPFRITRKDGKLFAFAGIWEEAPVGGGEPRFAIITTAANELMRPIHARMPVILDQEEEQEWLSGSEKVWDMIRLLASPTAVPMRAYEVSREVNRASVDVPDLIRPVAEDSAPGEG